MLVAAGAFGTYYYATQRGSTAPTGPKVLVTFYPIYDFAANIGGDRIDLNLLVPASVDVHEFEPTPSTIHAVATASVLIYNGAGLEPWVASVITAAENPHLVTVDSSQGISLVPVPPQFQQGNRTLDPHIWLDPVNAKQQVNNILAGLIAADPTQDAYFTANARVFEAKLDSLNREILNVTTKATIQTFVTFHEAFAYFAHRYNLTQVAIAGPFEEEPTPSDIQHVVDAIHTYHLCYVGYESLENPAIAQSIATETNASLVLMDPVEGLKAADQALGKDYLVKMQDNLDSFSLALNHVGCS